MWKQVLGLKMKVKNKDDNMLVEGNALRHIWAKYFDEGLCTGKHRSGR